MGIRNEIKQVLRDIDVRSPWPSIYAIEKIVNRPKPKVKKVPYIKITKEGDESTVTGHGVSRQDAAPLLIRALKAVARDLEDGAACQDCANKEECPDAR